MLYVSNPRGCVPPDDRNSAFRGLVASSLMTRFAFLHNPREQYTDTDEHQSGGTGLGCSDRRGISDFSEHVSCRTENSALDNHWRGYRNAGKSVRADAKVGRVDLSRRPSSGKERHIQNPGGFGWSGGAGT